MVRWKPHRGWLLIAALCASVAALAGIRVGRWASQESPTNSKSEVISGLLIEQSALDFGEVWGNQDFAIRFPVRNVTNQTIHIDEFQTGCDCQPIEPKPLTIPPGETREIRLALDAKKQSPGMVGRPRRLDTEIRPVLHGKSAAKAWKVRGTVRPLIATDTPAVLFGESNRVGQPPVARRLKVQFHDPGVASAELAPPVAEVRVLPGNTPSEWTVVVTPFTDRASGPFRGTLTITNLSPDGRTPIASLNLPVEGALLEADK